MSGVALRKLSPDLFRIETPVIIGSEGNVAFIVFILALITIPILDFLSGPRSPGWLHEPAIRWLNDASAWDRADGRLDRPMILASCAAAAIGEETIFRYVRCKRLQLAVDRRAARI